MATSTPNARTGLSHGWYMMAAPSAPGFRSNATATSGVISAYTMSSIDSRNVSCPARGKDRLYRCMTRFPTYLQNPHLCSVCVSRIPRVLFAW